MTGNKHCVHHYMRRALEQAHCALLEGEVPIGAIVVDETGTIIGSGYNQVERKKTQAAHAELLAIEQATQVRGDWRLDGCSLFVTLEPCKMCMGLIQLSRIGQLIYAADSPRFGYQLDNTALSSVYKKDVLMKNGICADEAGRLLKQFFQLQRKKKDEWTKKRSGRDTGSVSSTAQ